MKIELDGINWVFNTETVEEGIFYDQYWMTKKGMDEARNPSYYYVCCNCGVALDSKYSILMAQLQEAKLLPEDYKHYCCLCYVLEKIGALELKDHFDVWYENGDELQLDFATNSLWEKGDRFRITVHDYKKVLFQ